MNLRNSQLGCSNVFWGKLDLSKLDQMNFTAKEGQKYSQQKDDLLVCEGGDVGRKAMCLRKGVNSNLKDRPRCFRLPDIISILLLVNDFALSAETKHTEWILKTCPNLTSARETDRSILPNLGEVASINELVQSWSNSDVGPFLRIYYSAGGNTRIRYSLITDGVYVKAGPLTKADLKEKNEIVLRWAIDEPNGPTFISPESIVLNFPNTYEPKEGATVVYVVGKLVGSKLCNNRKIVVMDVDLIIFGQSGEKWQIGYRSKFKPQ